MHQHSKPVVIVFSGYNQRAVLAFLRTLERNEILYGIISKSKSDSIYETKYVDRIVGSRQFVELDTEEIFSLIQTLQEKIPGDRYLLAPSSEGFNRFFLEHRRRLLSRGVILPLIDEDLYEKISDKWKFRTLCLDAHIIVPAEFESLQHSPLPCVAKPLSYHDKNGEVYTPIILRTDEDRRVFSSHCDESDFYFQAYIHGSSYYLLYYFDRNGGVTKYSQQNFIQQPEGKSIIYARGSHVHEEDISDGYEQLFRRIAFHGLVMVEIKYDQGNYYMIEANPRFWGPSQLFVDAGINLFEELLADFGIIERVDSVNNLIQAEYHWFGGAIPSLTRSLELSYYDYDVEQYMKHLPSLVAADVYRRADSIRIYEKEFLCL